MFFHYKRRSVTITIVGIFARFAQVSSAVEGFMKNRFCEFQCFRRSPCSFSEFRYQNRNIPRDVLQNENDWRHLSSNIDVFSWIVLWPEREACFFERIRGVNEWACFPLEFWAFSGIFGTGFPVEFSSSFRRWFLCFSSFLRVFVVFSSVFRYFQCFSVFFGWLC